MRKLKKYDDDDDYWKKNSALFEIYSYPYVETQKKFTWVSLVKQNDYDRRNKGSKYQSWESG